MPATKRKITPADILSYEKYAAERAQFRKNIIPMKKNRRMEVGPFATFYFENYETMWMQVQEMLHIEKGGAEQIEGELEAYNPLVPHRMERRHRCIGCGSPSRPNRSRSSRMHR